MLSLEKLSQYKSQSKKEALAQKPKKNQFKIKIF